MRPNPVLEKLAPYRSGPSLSEIRERYRLDAVAQLSANEVPWGPFPEVISTLKTALDDLNRYPDGACDELRTVLAANLGVQEECLVFGNGSCELLMLLGQAFLSPDRHAIFPHPSFVMYRSIALAQGASFTPVPLRDLEYDLTDMLAAIRQDTSVIIICNPNNPTGAYLEPPVVRSFMERVPPDTVVVLDEAYVEFVTSPAYEDSAAWLADYPNLVILRTFSKIYGLAGLRIGYAVADPQVVAALDKIRQPYNVDTLAQVAAAESLRHPERLEERRQLIAAERSRLARRLDEMGIRYHPSQANFLLVDVTSLAVPGPEAAQALLERGVLIRSGYAMDCPGWIRVTIGEAEESDLFLSIMEELRRGPLKSGSRPLVNRVEAEALSPES